MLKQGPDLLARLGGWMTTATQTSVLTNAYGLARSLLACATLITLSFNSVDTLFIPAAGSPPPPHCAGIAAMSVYCVTSLELGKAISIVILLLVVAGLYPRWTAIPHWWVAFSFQNSVTTLDGGDQAAAVLALLIVPIALVDGRRTHWDAVPARAGEPTERQRAARLLGLITVCVIRFQVAFLYFHAGVAKFGVGEWADGTAMYYWLNNTMFGSPPWYDWLFDPIIHSSVPLSIFTWSMMLGEVVLAFALLLPQRTWKYFLIGAIAFHAGIALTMGLLSFAVAMIAMDVLFLHPADRPLRAPRWWSRVNRRYANRGDDGLPHQSGRENVAATRDKATVPAVSTHEG